MKIKTTELLLLIFLFILFESCDNSSSNSEDSTNTSEKSSVNDDCGVDDGNHTASIDYYNPETGHQATYDLDVDVVDCEVTEINFNNGGWLDDSHFSPTELDSDGNCEIEDDRGREYTVHIDD
jgi:hypothetical protein